MRTIQEKLLADFEIRKTAGQKAAFRTWLRETLTGEGYTVTEEKGNFSTNVVVGDAEKADLLLTAHYDTCPVLPIPNFITPRNPLFYILYQLLLCLLILGLSLGAEIALLLLWKDCPIWLAIGVVYVVMIFLCWWLLSGPANKHTANDNTSGVLTLLEIAHALPAAQRERVCFVFFDNEEKGLLGSAAFAGKHPNIRKNTLVLNFDCVSDGDHIHFFPARGELRNSTTRALLETAYSQGTDKTVTVTRGIYPSDQKRFVRGIGICALKHHPFWGYYMDRIHTARDTVLDERNIALLRDGTVRFITSLTEETEAHSE